MHKQIFAQTALPRVLSSTSVISLWISVWLLPWTRQQHTAQQRSAGAEAEVTGGVWRRRTDLSPGCDRANLLWPSEPNLLFPTKFVVTFTHCTPSRSISAPSLLSLILLYFSYSHISRLSPVFSVAVLSPSRRGRIITGHLFFAFFPTSLCASAVPPVLFLLLPHYFPFFYPVAPRLISPEPYLPSRSTSLIGNKPKAFRKKT